MCVVGFDDLGASVLVLFGERTATVVEVFCVIGCGTLGQGGGGGDVVVSRNFEKCSGRFGGVVWGGPLSIVDLGY